jgi:acetyltransferase-like isoleucine patch superfamily enzyme
MMAHIRILNFLRGRLFALLFAHQFARYGRGTRVIAPVAIEGVERIHLGDGVLVAAQCCLAAVPHTGATECRLEIGEGTTLGRFNHIYATRMVRIGRKVLTANGVYIADNQHGFRDPTMAVIDQAIVQLGDVEIGDGSWLGQNVCVIGARIGKHCVIGANAVVTSDIPDYCVAVGTPARIIRRYIPDRGEWVRTDASGSAI